MDLIEDLHTVVFTDEQAQQIYEEIVDLLGGSFTHVRLVQFRQLLHHSLYDDK